MLVLALCCRWLSPQVHEKPRYGRCRSPPRDVRFCSPHRPRNLRLCRAPARPQPGQAARAAPTSRYLRHPQLPPRDERAAAPPRHARRCCRCTRDALTTRSRCTLGGGPVFHSQRAGPQRCVRCHSCAGNALLHLTTCSLRNSAAPLRRLPPRPTFPATARKIRLIIPPASSNFHRLVYNFVYIRVYTPGRHHPRDRATRSRWRYPGILTKTRRFSVALWPLRTLPPRSISHGTRRNSGGLVPTCFQPSPGAGRHRGYNFRFSGGGRPVD